MPELPEVETVRRQLEPKILGLRVEKATLTLPRILEVGSKRGLAALKGRRIRGLRRHGKYLMVDLGIDGPQRTLVVHLGMTGALTFHPAGLPTSDEYVTLVSGYQKAVGIHGVDKHTHFVFDLEGGHRLYFRDPRTFGKLLLLPYEGHAASPRLAKLGPDALGLRREEFVERFWSKRGKRAVKTILLDQSFIAGVGNIYADEACFTAGVKPQRRSQFVTRKQVGELATAVEEALGRGLQNCGTSFSDFIDAEGQRGSNQEYLKVYGRGGEACERCEGVLKKGVVAQRGTVWCPRCQR